MSVTAFAQEQELFGFRPVGNDLCWQYVYETPLNANEIIDYFQVSGIFEHAQCNKNQIWGTSKRKPLNRKAAGVSGVTMGKDWALLNYPISYTIRIDVKDKKYRVTLSNIVAHPDISLSYGGVSTNDNMQISACEILYNFKKGKFKTVSGCESVGTCFFYEFLIDTNNRPNDNW